MSRSSRPINAQLACLPAGEEQRQTRRRAVNFGAILESEGVTAHSVQIVDISETGFRVHAEADVEKDSSLFIKLSGLEAVRARVVWTGEGQFGCELDEPLHPATIDLLMGVKATPRRRPTGEKPVFGTRRAD